MTCLILATETPPLSAGSGYSCYSPGPTSPLPQSEFNSQTTATKITRTALDSSLSTPTQPEFLKPADPLATRFPFFEKYKNKMPAYTANNNSASTSLVRKNTSDSIDSVSPYRSTTSSTTSSRPVIKDVRRPISPIDSGSESGGLAYANSTDDDGELSRSQSSISHPDKPTFDPTLSARRHRPSESEPSKNSQPQRFHKPSASSLSVSTAGSHAKTNSAAIAQALGLSQTPPSNYSKIGGPGVMGGRNGSISRRNARPDSMEEMEKALEDAKTKIRNKQPSFGSSSQHSRRDDTISTVDSSRKDNDVMGSGGGGPKAHRSNTIRPRPTSPDKALKLPVRALTSPKLDRDKNLDGTDVRKERVAKVKVCLKCQKIIDNGRWVSVDAGGVLCERCWKNMYLPKVRFIPCFPIDWLI